MPLQRIPVWCSGYLDEFPKLARLRLQVFSTSCRFVPLHTCWPYFVPDPLMGFFLQGFAPLVKPYVVSNAVSLMTLVDTTSMWHRFGLGDTEVTTSHC